MTHPESESIHNVLLAAARGLFIIDPDDDQTIRKFAALHDPAWEIVRAQNPDRVGTPTAEIYAQMFRLMLDPGSVPEVPEPTGLGAVIQSNGSGALVRITPHGQPGLWLNTRLPDEVLPWDNIVRPVAVLSLGCADEPA